MNKLKCILRFKNIITFILFILCIIILTYDIITFINWKNENDLTWKFENNFDNVKFDDLFSETDSNYESDDNYESGDNDESEENAVDFISLKKVNEDTIGWIYVSGTNINYPIVQYSDNSYYLNHTFDKSSSSAGWIFLDYRNDINNLNYNTIIYGHARKDGSMFGSLKNVLKDSWLDNKENHLIKLITKNKEMIFKVFSVYHIETENYYLQTFFDNKNDFKSFLDIISFRSIYDFDVLAKRNDKILTLSTCYKNNEKLVVHAKLIN